MADPTPLDFSEAGTLRIARQACAVIGHADAELERLRLGENAIYRVVGAPLVVRIARSLQMLDDVRKEMRVARWLEQAGLPAARLAAETGDDALVVDGRYPVTFWQLIRSTAPEPDEADLGRLLRQLHTLQPPEWVQLPVFWPFVRVAERLDSPPAAADPEAVAFLAKLFVDLQAQYQDLAVTGVRRDGFGHRRPPRRVRVAGRRAVPTPTATATTSSTGLVSLSSARSAS